MSAKKGKVGKGGAKSRGSKGVESSTRNEEKKSGAKPSGKRVPKTGKDDVRSDGSSYGGETH
ncbi:MAG TPA: hypothetical protein VGB73_18685 [Pyrinomonadaceae bacterium]|jgi:hypothetical protein